MTGQCKPSEGPWTVGKFQDTGLNNQISVHPAICTVYGAREEAEANAHIIAEAGTVYHETKLTPRQLLAQRDELLAALKLVTAELQSMVPATPNMEENPIWQKIFIGNTAIANAEKGEK